MRADLLLHRLGNALRTVVQFGRQIANIQFAPAIRTAQRCDFTRKRPAGNRSPQAAAMAARRAAIRLFAVSTAMAASRQ
jgi:hypothetical protein